MFRRSKMREELAGLAFHRDSLRYVQSDRRERISLPEGPDGDLEPAFLDLRKRLGGFRCPVVLGIPARDVKFDVFHYPRMPLSDVRDSLILDFEDHFSFPWSEAVLDVAEVNSLERERRDEKGMTVLAAVSRRAWIDSALAAARRAGLPIRAVEPMSVAFLRSLATEAGELQDGAYLAVWVGPG